MTPATITFGEDTKEIRFHRFRKTTIEAANHAWDDFDLEDFEEFDLPDPLDWIWTRNRKGISRRMRIVEGA